jgi:uncharacterized membrane protein
MHTPFRPLSPVLAQLARFAPAIVALSCAVPQAFALPLLPGAEVSPTGTTVALRPELAGLVLADTNRRFSVPDGAGGTVRGHLQDRVVRSTETGTLIFSQRIVLDRASSTVVSPGEWTISGETAVTTDVDYRTDGLGSVGASSSQRGATGSTVRYKLPRAMGPGESTYFHDMLTNALAFNSGGQTVINGTGLPPITLRTYRPTGAPQPYYTATPLGYASSYAVLLNDHGQVSMTVGDAVNGIKSVLWQPDQPNGIEGSSYPIPTLPGFPYNEAGRINNLGQVAGTDYFSADRSDLTQRAFLWTPSVVRGSVGSVADLGVFPGGSYSAAHGINDRGEVAGCGDTSPGRGSPLLWSAGTVTAVAIPPGGFGCGYALNADGAMAGFGAFTAGTYQGFTWTPAVAGGSVGTTVTVDMVGGAEYQGPGAATDINDSGVAIGAAELGYPETALTHGYVWGPAGLADLGFLELPGSINNAGVGVGSLNGGTARLYRNGIASTLRWFVSPAQGWTMGLAYDVNNIEQITGLGWAPFMGYSQLLLTPVRIATASPSPCGRPLPYVMNVTGTGFTASARALFNGMALPTTRVDSTRLQVTIPATLAGMTCGASLFVANDDGTSSTVRTF